MADFFGVSEAGLAQWRRAHAAFREALDQGSALADAAVADAAVAESLFRRATGYSYEAVKVVADAKTGARHIVPYTEHCPPDTSAAMFWLKNRRPDLWRDKAASAAEDEGATALTEIRVVLVRPGEEPAVRAGGADNDEPA